MKKLLGILSLSFFFTAVSFVMVACGDVATMRKHTWVKEKDVAPNCTDQGYTLYIDADDSTQTYKGNFTFIDYDAHDFENGDVVVVPPTCTEEGYTEHFCAHNSKHSYKDTYTPIDPNAHEWVVNVNYQIGDYSADGIDGEYDPTDQTAATVAYLDDPDDTVSLDDPDDPRAMVDEWKAVNGFVPSNCIAKGYTAYICVHDHNHVKIEYHQIIDGVAVPTEIDPDAHNWVIDTNYTVGDYSNDDPDGEYDPDYNATRPDDPDYTPRSDDPDDPRVAVNGVVPRFCLGYGYRAYKCSFSGDTKTVLDTTIPAKVGDDGNGGKYTADGHHWEVYTDYT
ncbi:MAG: hypothetical protein LBQ05_01850, partial [Christensenellaceae bacterium]|nr:hypothetical protein [Christensenellaceae bacterium]